MSIIIGIDPGLKGGIAVTHPGGTYAYPMPVSGGELDVKGIVEHLTWMDPVVYIEKVGAMPKQGVSSTFTFGKGYGTIIGICGALKIPMHFVTPQAWKKEVLAGTDKSKDAAIAYCLRAYPRVSLIAPGCRVAHDGMADALCIADFGWRKHEHYPVGRGPLADGS